MKTLAVACSILVLAASGGAARAGELHWEFKSNHPNIVHLEFFSQTRNHVWPGDGEVWVIDDYDWHTYNLNCNSGEKICFGAAVSGDYSTYWGVGLDDDQGCDDCCAICGRGDPPRHTLNP